MKNNPSKTTFLIMVVVVVISCLFIFNNKRARREKTQALLESARKQFPSYDSAFTKNDTMFFYEKGSYIGKTVTVTE